MRTPLMAMAVAAMAAIGFAAPAQATVNTVDMPFGMAYGNSATTGTIHFTDGYTASVSGTVHAASDARQVCAYGMNGGTTSKTVCSPYAYAGEPNQSLSGSMRIEAAGGVQRVYLTMFDSNGIPLTGEFCGRSGCTRDF